MEAVGAAVIDARRIDQILPRWRWKWYCAVQGRTRFVFPRRITMTSRDQRLRGPARALLVIDQLVLADIVKLALNHGHYSARVAQSIEEATTVLGDWRPHLVILDMDIAGSGILERL